MPFKIETIPAEKVIEHNGVTVYHAYKNDDIETPYQYWFMLDEYGVESESFDIRHVRKLLKDFVVDSSQEGILRQAIEEGVIRKEMTEEEILEEFHQ